MNVDRFGTSARTECAGESARVSKGLSSVPLRLIAASSANRPHPLRSINSWTTALLRSRKSELGKVKALIGPLSIKAPHINTCPGAEHHPPRGRRSAASPQLRNCNGANKWTIDVH